MIIHDFLHEYNFPHHDFLLDNLDFIQNYYKDHIEQEKIFNQYNVDLPFNHIWNFLNDEILKIIYKNYYVSEYFSPSPIGIYLQDNKSNISVLHHHSYISSISGVFYINPPKPEEGGGLKMLVTSEFEPLILHPKPNKLYLFPSWVLHSPLPQTTSTPRICLNWGYLSRLRPIHKLTGQLW